MENSLGKNARTTSLSMIKFGKFGFIYKIRAPT